MSEEMIEAPKKKNPEDFKRKVPEINSDLAASQSIPIAFPGADQAAAAIASGIALSRLISILFMDPSDRADAREHVENVLGFLFQEAKEIPEATLGRHGIKKDPQGRIQWGEEQ